MKVLPIQQIVYQKYYCGRNGANAPQNLQCKNLDLQNSFYYPTNISFGLRNAEPLRKLFMYGLPCMYTGVEMIAPQKVQRLMQLGLRRMSALDICNEMYEFQNKLLDKEREIFEVIKEQAQTEPNKSLKEIMQSLKTQYEYELISKQMPIFKTLEAYAYCLPEELRPKFEQLMTETYDKINHRPIVTRFSVTEFRYKLEKIKDDIGKLHDKKSLGVVKHLIKMSEDFAPKTNAKNIYGQKKILSCMERTLKRSVLRENEALLKLFEDTNAKINDEEVLIPFSRKAFIYDLSQIIKKIDNSELKEIFMKIAEKLPTSTNSTAAYIMKASKQPAEKIIFSLLWPSMASVEHLLPSFCGGADEMSNYGGATAEINSERGHRDFMEQVRRYPDTPKNCQKFLDRLIKYARAGIFEKEGIDVGYIEQFKKKIATLSEGTIILDTSKLYKGGRFQKPEPALEYLDLNQ